MECNIDFIKWLCDKADGFEFYEGDFIDDNYIETPCLSEIHQNEFDSDDWLKSFYPLLLQRAIEGVLDKDIGYRINYTEDGLVLSRYEDIKANYWRTVDIDQAKESALKYILEQENKL